MVGLTRPRIRALVVAVGWVALALGGRSPAVGAGPGVVSVAAGENHSCAVRTDGTVWCWGAGADGQLGDGTTGDPVDQIRTTPVRVRFGSGPLRDASKVTAGASHSCAIRSGGRVVCWGDDTYGQLGSGQGGAAAPGRLTAVRVRYGSGYLTGVKRVSAGDHHTCALRSDGRVLCWGDGSDGQLGDGSSSPGHLRTVPTRVRQGDRYLTGVRAMAAGGDHTCAVKGDGSVWCWGSGSLGQLGDGDLGAGHHRTKATRVRRGSGYLARASEIAAGPYHTCASRTDGSAWCWGWEKYGAIGDASGGANIVRSMAVQVLRGSGVLTRVTGIAAGAGHSCARRDDTGAMCWGLDTSGQLGDGTTGDPANGRRDTAVRVVRPSGPLGRVTRLDGGLSHTCAFRTDRTAWCWGSNAFGQLGIGSHDDDPHPYPRKVLFP